MKIDIEAHKHLVATLETLRNDRYPHWQLWRELADFILPRRYTWLLSPTERNVRNAKNPKILDGTGTKAARTLAAGMMNGLTSPSRPWFRLRLSGYKYDQTSAVGKWLDEVARRLLLIMAESNFYNSLATMYLDLVVFGSAAMLIYEDYDSVIRCYNPNLGEFYLAQSSRLQVNTFAREFIYTTAQCLDRWGKDNLTDAMKRDCEQKGAALQNPYTICHVIEPKPDYSKVAVKFTYQETYWVSGANSGEVLEQKGYNELPGIFPRWELSGNDAYGTSPGMDALGDIIQLQHETKKKAQGLDKLISPPMVADIQLKHRPTALMPNGITFVAGQNNTGMKPAYQLSGLPIDAITADIMEVQSRIKDTFYNNLFTGISDLQTVRSAAEIYERKEEKLIMLGSVHERFETEALDPAIERIFGIAVRKRLLPPPPEGYDLADIEIQYESIFSVAQRGAATAPTERWLQLIGSTVTMYPKAVNAPDWDELISGYGRDIGVPAAYMKDLASIKAENAQQDQQAAAQQAQSEMGAGIEGAKLLSETDVGGGQNALTALLGT